VLAGAAAVENANTEFFLHGLQSRIRPNERWECWSNRCAPRLQTFLEGIVS
jgi:hypothetical protein